MTKRIASHLFRSVTTTKTLWTVLAFVIALALWDHPVHAQDNPPPEAAAPKASVAVMHISTQNVENKTVDGSIEDTLAKSVNQAGHEAVPPAETEAFLESEPGKPYANCLSVECSAKAGQALGVTYVMTAHVTKSNGQTTATVQLISADKRQLVTAERANVIEGATLGQTLAKLGTGIMAKIEPPPGPQSVEALPPSEGETPEQRAAREERFYKGTLTTIGPLEIIPRNDRVGVIIGYRRLGFNHYAHIEPQVDLRFFPDDITKDSKLRLGFAIPFNMQIFSGDDQNGDQKIDKFDIKLREEDWDSWRDAFQIIRYIQYGRKEDNLYVNVNRAFATTIGHGPVMRRYIQNLDYFTTRVSAEVDYYNRYGGFELYTNDVTRATIVSTLFFIKPGSFFSDHWMAESLSFGFHYSMDWDAPVSVDPLNSKPDGSYRYSGDDIHFLGADMELKVVRWPDEKPNVDVKLYFDYTKWLDEGQGMTFGALGRFNLYTKIRQAFRVRLEFRAYQDNYTPSYFGPFYEVMKYKFFSERKPPKTTGTTQNVNTKYSEYASRSASWDHFGLYTEFSYALLDYVGLTIALNKDSGGSNGDFIFHVEVPATKYFVLSGTYYKANFQTVKNIFDPTAPNTMLIALARLRPVQILSFQFGVRKTVQPSVIYYPNLDDVWELKADLDLSWEF